MCGEEVESGVGVADGFGFKGGVCGEPCAASEFVEFFGGWGDEYGEVYALGEHHGLVLDLIHLSFAGGDIGVGVDADAGGEIGGLDGLGFIEGIKGDEDFV